MESSSPPKRDAGIELRPRLAICSGWTLVLAIALMVAVHPEQQAHWTAIVLGVVGMWGMLFVMTSRRAIRLFWTHDIGRLAYLLAGSLFLGYVVVTDDLENWFPIFLVSVMSVSALIGTGYWRLWAFWLPHPRDRSVAHLLASTAVAIFVLTLVFSTITGFLYVHGTLASEAELPYHPFLKVEEDYGWHFCDAIPALKVPQTLNWAEPAKLTDPVSGMLLLTFKVLVILPVVGLVTELVQQRRSRSAGRGGEGLTESRPPTAPR